VNQARTVALLTPSHRKDIDRLALLCESIDRHVIGHEKHYVIVNDDDMPLFSRFNSARRVVLPGSQFLPKWLKLVPPFLLRKGRRVWWSFRSGPVHGWHIQQLLKIAAASSLPEERFRIVDSDNVFFRPFDVRAYAGGARVPLYVDRGAIEADAPLHAIWTRNCDQLLGQARTAFPADDYIGNVIVWDKRAVQDLTKAIAAATKTEWQVALCKTRALSEYLLYGHFVRGSQSHFQAHEIVTNSLASAYWEEKPLDRESIALMIEQAPKTKVALCIESFLNTSVSAIREAVGLSPAGSMDAGELDAKAGVAKRHPMVAFGTPRAPRSGTDATRPEIFF
jgi:hypothetical protein